MDESWRECGGDGVERLDGFNIVLHSPFVQLSNETYFTALETEAELTLKELAVTELKI